VKYHILLPTPEQVGTPVDNAQWVAILTSCSGYEPYHKSPAGVGSDVGVSVADFLIYNPLFPRSVLRCLRECQEAAHAISGRPASECGNDVEASLRDLIEWLERHDIEDLVRGGLHEALTRVVNETHRIGDTIHRVYFEAAMQMPPTKQAAKSIPSASQSQSNSSLQS